MVADERHYAPGTYPSLPPPADEVAIGWLRRNLLSRRQYRAHPGRAAISFIRSFALVDLAIISAIAGAGQLAGRLDKPGACWTMMMRALGCSCTAATPDQLWRVDLSFLL